MRRFKVRTLYVAGQDAISREWIPVAVLHANGHGFELRYTKGAQRLPGFTGFGRMDGLADVYQSPVLFPFFQNRLISKRRPEYSDFRRWVGLEGADEDSPLATLAITGGGRATDSFEIVPAPEIEAGTLRLDFFPRGLRYLEQSTLEEIKRTKEGERLYLMHDLQNERHGQAIAMRLEKPAMVVGYVPRYYCAGIHSLLETDPSKVVVTVRRNNIDAPLDLRLLCHLEAEVSSSFALFEKSEDFEPLTDDDAAGRSIRVLQGTSLELED